MHDKKSYVYILASERNGTLYVGVTADLARRVHQHKTKQAIGFTRKHDVSMLVYYEVFDDREMSEGMEAFVETANDRENEPGMAGFICNA
jgi:predicted GIY-YIG superfamily endonuclease